ncbi:MAG TPA: hypothetical protein VJ932_09655, partial [Alkalispirochaeta sp.]|nr:hypothetical protein [Alkalispirochaeta sp.]
PEPEPQEEAPAPDPSLRRKLKDMIDRVRDQLGPEPEPSEDEPDTGLSKQAKLFEYLMGLAGSLPPTRDQEYRQSEERLKLMGVHARLSGHTTLREKARGQSLSAPTGSATTDSAASGDPAQTGKPPRLSDTFDYLSTLSGYHPDPDVGGRLSERAHRLSDRLRNL